MTYLLIAIWKLLVTIPLWFYQKIHYILFHGFHFLLIHKMKCSLKCKFYELIERVIVHELTYPMISDFSLNPRRLMLTIFLWNQGTCISSGYQTVGVLWSTTSLLLYDLRVYFLAFFTYLYLICWHFLLVCRYVMTYHVIYFWVLYSIYLTVSII